MGSRTVRAGVLASTACALALCKGGGLGAQSAPPLSMPEAYRFLNQATFGATEADARELIDIGVEDWIERQIAQPASLQLPHLESLLVPNRLPSWHNDRVDIWFRHAIDGPDQLRQRVAFALSQILVVSEFGDLNGRYPRLEIDGPDTVRRSRLIPTVSADQYAATLARWIGVPDEDLSYVAPNLHNFAQRDLGFLI